MTAEEYFALPLDELPHPQLIDGELVVTNPQALHQRIIVRLLHQFYDHERSHPGAGEMGIEIATPLTVHDVYLPDLWWIPDGSVLADGEYRFDPPPPLVVEVRSPSTWRYDTGVKPRRYGEAGVAEVWLVDTVEDAVRVHRRSPGAPAFDVEVVVAPPERLATPLIPGWEVDLEDLLRPT